MVDRIAEHLDDHDGYVAFSGGKDSLVVLHLALQAEPNVPVVFFDSGLEYPETITYLDVVAEQLGIPDGIEVEAAVPDLLTLLIRTGTWDHHIPDRDSGDDVRNTLITHPAAQAHRRHGPGELWGVRAAESDARRRLYLAALTRQADCSCCRAGRRDRDKHGGVITRQDGTTAFSPIWDWADDDVWNYLARHRSRSTLCTTNCGASAPPTGRCDSPPCWTPISSATAAPSGSAAAGPTCSPPFKVLCPGCRS